MSKEVKVLLKEAREAVKNKDYKTSLKLCKSILRADKDNYMALVLLGVTFQEGGPKDQAPFAFRKAALLNPTQLLAWQGLASYYEKENNDNKKDLIDVYCNIINNEMDLKKYAEYCNKLVSVANQTDNDTVAFIIKYLHQEACKADSSKDKQNIVWEQLAILFVQLAIIPSEFNDIYEQALSVVVTIKSAVTIDYYKRLLRLLYKNKKYHRLIDTAISMNNIYTSEVYPLEWICKIYTESLIENNQLNCQCDDISKYIDKLLELNRESSGALLAKAVMLYNDNLFVECRDLLNSANSVKLLPHSWVLLAQCNYKLYCYMDVEVAAEQALIELAKNTKSNNQLSTTMNMLLCCALSKQNDSTKWEKAIDKCKQILQDSTDFNILLAYIRVLIQLKRYDLAEEQLVLAKSIQNDHPDYYLIKAIEFKQKNQFDDALAVLTTYPRRDNCEILLEIGKIYWKQNNFKDSLISWVEAAKIDSNNYICFIHLGHYYLNCNDKDKARRCYQKAFKINPKSVEAGFALSNIYREQKNWAANQQLLESVIARGLDTRCKWAWLQLGLNHLDQGSYDDAIKYLRSVIRSDPLDSHAWESLADAYLARGAFTSALKSYQRAFELDPDAVYSCLQIASIKQLLGDFNDAKIEYETILKINANYVPALKGLAETNLSLAKCKYSEQLIGLGRDYAQSAIDTVTIALKERNDLACLWKILAGSCNLIAQFPEKHSFAYIVSTLAGKNTENTLSMLDRNELFHLATRAYSRALTLTDADILLWHDISSNYYLQSKHICDAGEQKKLQELALIASKHCVSSSTSKQHWQHWNLLATVAVDLKQLKLAQHAYIKAINLEKNNAVTWTNLGTLYLMLGDLKLANEAFDKAQRIEPGYVQSWIGQALIAESLGHEDAMDLFRHSAQIGPQNIQSILGYSHWVCLTLTKEGPRANELYSIKNMHAIPVAADALEWYTEKITNNACAWNMLGLLKERQKLLNSAENAFRQALKYVDEHQKDLVLTNLGRVLVTLNKFTEAIDCYKQISEASFISGCGLALAYFKAEMYQESYSTYETTLEWLAPDDNNKSHVLVAMATIAYMFEGPDDAKTLLFQCIELEPPSLFGLFAACAIGLLHGDIKLAQLTLNELIQFKDDSDYLCDIADLRAFHFLIQNKQQEAKSSLSCDLHRHPTEANLWLSLARTIFHCQKSPDAASKCASAAINLGRSILDISKILCLLGLADILIGNFEKALRNAQKAVHSHPNVAEGWILLISAYYPICEQLKHINRTEWLRLVINHVRRQTFATRPMTQWLSNHERKVTQMVEQLNN